MEEIMKTEKSLGAETITSTVHCVNTNYAYVYELQNHDIVSITKVFVKA